MAIITRQSPSFGDLALFDPFKNMEDYLKGFTLRPFYNEMEAASIKVDVKENDKTYKIQAELPGVKKEDIKVQVDGNRVSISTETIKEKEEKEGDRIICRECYRGTSYRSLTMESAIDEAKVEAKYENGVLELILPKLSGNNAKQITIK